MLTCVRRYAAYPLSRHPLEEMRAEHSVGVDHATGHRAAFKTVPLLAAAFSQREARWVLMRLRSRSLAQTGTAPLCTHQGQAETASLTAKRRQRRTATPSSAKRLLQSVK